jgi:hypothetical protein
MVFRTSDNTLWQVNTAGTGWLTPSVQTTALIGTIVAGQIAAGAIGADALAATIAMLGVITSTSYTAGTSNAGPVGYKLSGPAFTTTYIGGATDSTCHFELEGSANFGGHKVATVNARAMTAYNRILNGSFYYDKTGWTDNNGTFPFTWISTGYDSNSGCIGMVTTAEGALQASRCSQPFNAPPTNATVTLSLWVKVDSGMTSATVTATLFNTTTGTATNVLNGINVVSYTSWTNITADITSLVSAGGDFVLQLFANGKATTAGQTVYLDNVKIII